MEQNSDEIKVIGKATSIIEVLVSASNSMGINEISKLLSIHSSTVYRILNTLNQTGWVYEDTNGKYMIGGKIFDKGYLNGLKDLSYFIMKRYSTIENQAMNLAVLIDKKCFILQQARSKKIIDYVPPIGSQLTMYASACGKILLSEMPDNLLSEMMSTFKFEKLTEHTITNKNDFIPELRKVRENGYALDVHESLENGNCIAVPVRNEIGNIIASLSFSGFIGDMDNKSTRYYYDVLCEASKELSEKYLQLSVCKRHERKV